MIILKVKKPRASTSLSLSLSLSLSRQCIFGKTSKGREGSNWPSLHNAVFVGLTITLNSTSHYIKSLQIYKSTVFVEIYQSTVFVKI